MCIIYNNYTHFDILLKNKVYIILYKFVFIIKYSDNLNGFNGFSWLARYTYSKLIFFANKGFNIIVYCIFFDQYKKKKKNCVSYRIWVISNIYTYQSKDNIVILYCYWFYHIWNSARYKKANTMRIIHLMPRIFNRWRRTRTFFVRDKW